MNYIKTMLCGSFVGIDKLERLKLLQSDPLINESEIAFKEPETDIESRFNNSRTYALCEELHTYHHEFIVYNNIHQHIFLSG